MFTRAMAWQECPISRDRMIEINQMALSYFRSQFPSSWGHQYLADRFGQDLTDDLRFQPGQAPSGWTGLVTHLGSRGVTGVEMTAAGVATSPAPAVSSTGSATGSSSRSSLTTRFWALSAAGTPTAAMHIAADQSTSTPPTLPCSTRAPNSSAPTRWILPPVAYR